MAGSGPGFVALQRRITAGRQVIRMANEYPAHYVIFDLLADPDGPLLHASLAERRRWSICRR